MRGKIASIMLVLLMLTIFSETIRKSSAALIEMQASIPVNGDCSVAQNMIQLTNPASPGEQEWIDQFVDGGKIVSGYCYRTRNGVQEEHPGVDIAKKDGGRWTGGWNISAGINGHVEAIYSYMLDPDKRHYSTSAPHDQRLKNHNIVVIKDNATGNYYLYGHLSKINVRVCDNVTANTVIGQMGGHGDSCSNTFTPHLHLEIRKDKDGDGKWGRPEQDSIGRKNCSVAPLYGIAMNIVSRLTVVCERIIEGLYRFVVDSTNYIFSNMSITYIGITYLSDNSYEVVGAPVGWSYTTWAQSPGRVEWYTPYEEYAIKPGQTLSGFIYRSFCRRLSDVSFFTAPDDAGHGGGLDSCQVKIIGAGPPGVGGIVVPVDKFGLLAPYIGLASTIIVATVATALCVKHVKRRKEKQ